MLRFVIKRFLYGIAVMLGVAALVFFLFSILPGDPARMMLGQRADLASVEAIRKDLGLDKPTGVQFLNYLNDLSPISFHNPEDPASYWYISHEKYGNYKSIISTDNFSVVLKKPYLRRSYQSDRKVSEILSEAFPGTAVLAVVAIVFAMIVGIAIGILGAVYKDSWFDKCSLFISVLGMSVPSFFAAILMAWLFAFVWGDFTGLEMTGSLVMVDDFGEGSYISLKNLILPAITLGIRPLAVIAELTRSSLIQALSQDYIRTARAKGLSYRRVITRHALKNAMNPVVTAISGWFASLMAGAVFVEYVFDWEGIGAVIVDALEKYDFPVIMGAVLFIAILLVIINIFVDIVYAILDPRVKLA